MKIKELHEKCGNCKRIKATSLVLKSHDFLLQILIFLNKLEKTNHNQNYRTNKHLEQDRCVFEKQKHLEQDRFLFEKKKARGPE